MSRFEAVKRVKNFAAVVKVEDYPSCPRDDWDNLGKFYLHTRSVDRRECSEEDVEKAVLRIPVWKYEHSGILVKAGDKNPFSCPWDSCQCGWVLAFREDLLKEYGCKRITKKVLERAREVLVGEVEIYNQWLNGEVYGWETYKVDEDVADEDIEDEGELLDSCWGYYDKVDEVLKEAVDSLPDEAFMGEEVWV